MADRDGRVAAVKRSAIKPGREPLRRQGKSLARKARKQIDRQASEAWARGAKSKPCAVCGAAGVHAHHVITQQKLRQVAAQNGLDFERLRWDKRNRLPLCPRHHAAHHARTHPIPWVVLEQHCPKVFQLARELGLLWWLEQTYPQARSEAA